MSLHRYERKGASASADGRVLLVGVLLTGRFRRL